MDIHISETGHITIRKKDMAITRQNFITIFPNGDVILF